MLQYIIIFIVGFIETILYTAYLIAVNKKQPLKASLCMSIYLFTYLTIISYAIKNTETISLIATYVLSCGIGTYLKIKSEKNNEKTKA